MLGFLAAILAHSRASAQPRDQDMAQVEQLRAMVASQLQLMAANLLDELVFEWTQNPPFTVKTPVVLAGVSVPHGMGSGLTAFLENHYFHLVLRNPRTNILPVHCPECSAVVVHSKPQGTVLARGLDLPETLARVGTTAGAKFALHLDFEAEGSALVLRVRMTTLEPSLPIVHAKTRSTSTSSPALLRDPEKLKSAADARREYLDLLAGKDGFHFPIRVISRTYAKPDTFQQGGGQGATIAAAPYVWLEMGAESSFTQERLWTGGVSVGFTTLHEAHEGWNAGARITRLVSGEAQSLTHPDLHLFLGAAVFSIRGPNALSFRKSPLSPGEALEVAAGDKPRALFSAWRFGAESRIKNRFSAGVFLEGLTGHSDNDNLGDYLDIGILEMHCLGLEVGFWF